MHSLRFSNVKSNVRIKLSSLCLPQCLLVEKPGGKWGGGTRGGLLALANCRVVQAWLVGRLRRRWLARSLSPFPYPPTRRTGRSGAGRASGGYLFPEAGADGWGKDSASQGFWIGWMNDSMERRREGTHAQRSG